MISSVAVLAYEGVSSFGLGVTAEIFGCDRSAEGLPSYEYAVTAAAPGVLRTDVGLPIVVEAGLDRLSAADLGIVVCWASAPARSCLPPLGCLTAAGLPPTGSGPPSSPAATPRSMWTRTCSTSPTAR